MQLKQNQNQITSLPLSWEPSENTLFLASQSKLKYGRLMLMGKNFESVYGMRVIKTITPLVSHSMQMQPVIKKDEFPMSQTLLMQKMGISNFIPVEPHLLPSTQQAVQR